MFSGKEVFQHLNLVNVFSSQPFFLDFVGFHDSSEPLIYSKSLEIVHNFIMMG